MNCKECKFCEQIGRQQSQCGKLGRKKYYCENPNVYELKDKYGYSLNNFIGFGNTTVESPLQLKTHKQWCPLKGDNITNGKTNI